MRFCKSPQTPKIVDDETIFCALRSSDYTTELIRTHRTLACEQDRYSDRAE